MLELFPHVARVMPAALTYLAEIHYPHHCVAGLKPPEQRERPDVAEIAKAVARELRVQNTLANNNGKQEGSRGGNFGGYNGLLSVQVVGPSMSYERNVIPPAPRKVSSAGTS
jgi:hypothetical protein